MDAAPLPPSRAAATVVVVRPGDDPTTGAFEILLLRRSDVGQFGGMWVFPGGRVDDDDPGTSDLERARHAAVREAREEVGLHLEPHRLVTWSHWTPPAVAPKRYTTWFFVAPWTGDDVEVDGVEILDHRWMAPLDALDAGLPLAPPTIVTLHELHEARSLEALAHRADPPAYLTVVTTDADGAMVLLWHGDAGYESADAGAPGTRHRLVMPHGGQVVYERSAPHGIAR